jgi:hypothetical protein
MSPRKEIENKNVKMEYFGWFPSLEVEKIY